MADEAQPQDVKKVSQKQMAIRCGVLLPIVIVISVVIAACSGGEPIDTRTPDSTPVSTPETVVEEEEPEVAVEEEPLVATSTEQTDVEEVTIPEVLPHMIEINTLHYASIGVSLAKGEVLNVRMNIRPSGPTPSESLIFQLLDPRRRVVFDAGRIEGVYEFSSTAERSGVHLMNFIDDRGHCIIELHHDYEGDFWNYSQ